MLLLNKERSLRLLDDLSSKPLINLDWGVRFFLTTIQELLSNLKECDDLRNLSYLDLTNIPLVMSPFRLYLYLKPLYSNLGGSTTLAEPFTKLPTEVDLRLKPWYK